MTADVLDVIWARAMSPPDDREIYDWIAAEGELPNCYAVPGPFDVSLVPFVKAPLEALRNGSIREVVAMSAIQCLKTLIGEMWLLWSIENDPGPTQWLQRTDEEAREHCEERFLRLIECYPRVHRFFTANRHDKKTAVILFKHMWMRMEGCGSGNLQRKSVKNQMCSEVWQRDAWLPGRLKEAEGRLTQYRFNSKRYIESQPGEVIRDQEGKIIGDDILMAFNKWSQEEWGFQCASCSRLQPWLFMHEREDGSRAAVRWDKNEKTFRIRSDGSFGEPRWSELVQTIRYECLHCGHAHVDEPLTRTRMLDSGNYLLGNREAGSEGRSFSWNQLCMPGIPWFGHVKEFLFAIDQARKGFDLPLRLLFTKNFAKAFDPEKYGTFNKLPVIELLSQAQSGAKIVHEGITFDIPLMAVDVQDDHVWVLVQMWNSAGDVLNVWFGKLYTWQEVEEKQKEFGVPDQNVSIDISHRKHEVIVECSRHAHWELIYELLDENGKVTGEQREASLTPQPSGDPKKRRLVGTASVCWKALRGADRDYFNYKPRRGKNKGRSIPLVYTWPPESGDPCNGLRADDPIRKELAGRFCPIITWARPTVLEVAIARRDGHVKGVRLFTLKGPWNEELNRHWFSQKKVLERDKRGQGKWRWINFRDDHGLDCFCENIVMAFMKQILGGPALETAESSDQPGDGEPEA